MNVKGIKCPACHSKDTARKGFRYNKSGKKQKYRCGTCKAWFVFDDGFKRMRKSPEVVVRALHMLNDGLSLSKVKNHLWQHDNVKISRSGILYWTKKFSGLIKKTSSRT